LKEHTSAAAVGEGSTDGQRVSGWRIACAAGFLALLVVALLLPVDPASASKGGPVKIKAARDSLAPNSQGTLADSGSAAVKLRASGPRGSSARVVVSVQVRQPWSKWIQAGRSNVRIKAGRAATVRVRVGRAARDIARNCGAPSVRFQARAIGRSKGRMLKGSRKLKGQSFRCAVPNDVDLSKSPSCDFIAAFGNPCLQPFPNDYFTRPDSSSETGLRVNFQPDSTPKNSAGKHIEVDQLNTSDGFSPGQPVSLYIPGLDNQAAFDATGAVPLADISRTYEPGQPVLLLDAETGERQLIWTELDTNATENKSRNFYIRLGKNLKNGHRYLVVLRNLKDSSGKTIQAPAGFRLYRDNQRTNNPLVEKRRNQYEKDFALLRKEKISRSSLYLTWGFTTASTENLTGRALSIRNRAFAELGDPNLADGVIQGSAPTFTITESLDNPDGEGQLARRIRGTFEVPCFLDVVGCKTGFSFKLDDQGLPIRIPGNTFTARFQCNIPSSSVSGGLVVQKARPSLYGHGLMNEFNEANALNVRQLGNENGVMVCATDWTGLSSSDNGNPFYDDYPTAIAALQDLSKFPAIPDRFQQSYVNFMFLGRLMIHPDGFTDAPAFDFSGESVIDTSQLSYYGNSQGGMQGGALTALAPDFTRSVLYVPAINFSTVLERSTDFDDFVVVLNPSYPKRIERPLILSLVQMTWDRGEPNAYANNMTSNPLPGTPAHKVMIAMAYGDHVVANVATEVQARTIGAPLRLPSVAPSRLTSGLISPFFGHATLGDLASSVEARNGNAFFVWDIGPKSEGGTDPPPLTNTPPRNAGQNPHDFVIENSPVLREQIADFMKDDGVVTDPCYAGTGPYCTAGGYEGMP